MIIGIEHNEKYGAMQVSYIEPDGSLGLISKKLKESDMFLWNRSNEPTGLKGWDSSTEVKKKGGSMHHQIRLNRYRLEEIIQERFTPDDWSKVRSISKPKASYIDIETMVGPNGEFPEPELAEYPVIAINVVTSDNQVYQLNTLSAMQTEEQQTLINEANEYVKKFEQNFKMAYIYFETEKQMLQFFFHEILPKLTVVTGWNVIQFDWLTLVNRAQFHMIDITKNLISKVLNGRYKTPTHLAILDYIDMIEKFRPLKYVENNKLAYIAKRVLGISKLENPCNSFTEFIQQTHTFILYNIIDTLLVKLIDDKLHMLDSAYGIANTAEIEVSRIIGPVFMTELLMCRVFLGRKGYMWEQRIEKKEDEDYEGAFVKEPFPGFYKFISCFDFKSMYPNLQMMFNMSPDTYLGKADEIELSKLEKGSYVVTKNNTVFNLKFDSAARIILENLYNERVSAQHEIEQLKEKLMLDDKIAA